MDYETIEAELKNLLVDRPGYRLGSLSPTWEKGVDYWVVNYSKTTDEFISLGKFRFEVGPYPTDMNPEHLERMLIEFGSKLDEC